MICPMRDYLYLILFAAAMLLSGWRLRYWSERLPYKWAARKAPLHTVCSWCSVVITYGRQPVSHGICPPCAVRMRMEEELERAERLRSLPDFDEAAIEGRPRLRRDGV